MPSRESTRSVRRATDEDLATLGQLEGLLRGSKGWVEADFAETLHQPSSQILLFTDDETDERIDGFIAYRLQPEPAEILALGVARKFQHSGLGKALLGHVIKDAIQAGQARLRTQIRKSEMPAIEYFQARSFAVVRVLSGYYPDGEDAYVLESDLSGQERLSEF